MKIYVGADHRGFRLKAALISYLKDNNWQVSDEGDDELDPNDDFPQFAGRVAARVLASDDKDARGILICGNGQGICIAANRFRGIRAALGYNQKAARTSRNDDDSNVLCLPADELEKETAHKIVNTWLDTPFSGATRYRRRNQELDQLG